MTMAFMSPLTNGVPENKAPYEVTVSSAFEQMQTQKVVVAKNFIGNQFLSPLEGSYLDSFNPSNGMVWAIIPDSGEADIELAVKSAKSAFMSWSQTSAQKRSKIMMKIADLIEEKLDDFAVAESRDQGKPISLARAVDVPRCIQNFRFFATTILHDTNDSVLQQEPCKAINYVLKQPVGVAGLISPWNLPLYLLSFKVAPAIAAGNCVVAKPSEFTSVTAWLLAHVFLEAGLPAGVVNVVFGVGPKAGEALVRHGDVPLISFTGSTAVGKRIAQITAPLHKKLSLEMGGKNACIVFEDVDIKKSVPVIVRSSFANQGEICLCSSRIFVHERIFEEFTEEFVNQTKMWKVGNPQDPDVNMGALVSKEHWRKVTGFLDLAEKEGRKVLCGKEPLDLSEELKDGYYLRPTVIVGVDDSSDLMQEEIFGPVVCIAPFRTEFEVIQRANGVKYGLSASLWSKDVSRIHRVAQKLEVGTVWCNCWLVRELNMPFGGVKASGIGREGAKDSLEFFTEKKTVCIKID